MRSTVHSPVIAAWITSSAGSPSKFCRASWSAQASKARSRFCELGFISRVNWLQRMAKSSSSIIAVPVRVDKAVRTMTVRKRQETRKRESGPKRYCIKSRTSRGLSLRCSMNNSATRSKKNMNFWWSWNSKSMALAFGALKWLTGRISCIISTSLSSSSITSNSGSSWTNSWALGVVRGSSLYTC